MQIYCYYELNKVFYKSRKKKKKKKKKKKRTPMMWIVFPGPWMVDGKGITYIRCTNYSFL